MTEILFHGRGGQGAFTAARILGAAYALKDESSFALAFPSFGPERRGAPMRAFAKLGEKPIVSRSEVKAADFIVFLDETLYTEAALSGLKPNGKIVINSEKSFGDARIFAIDADGIAERVLGRRIGNTALLGALAALLGGASGTPPPTEGGAIRLTVADLHIGIDAVMAENLRAKNREVTAAAFEAVGGAR